MTAATLLESKLHVFDESAPERALVETADATEIARLLGEIGVRFERWDAEVALEAGADSDAVLAAYARSIARVQAAGGYGTVDVIRLPKGTPNTEPMRKKFLDEHTHSEDEVRFFVEGSGAFYLHLAGKVFRIVCVRGDLLSVPAATRHWFDMGPDPEFCAIRFFNRVEGWVAEYTGDPIASGFPLYE